jgi:predicted RNase H-like HicB family nuclease
MRTFYVAALVPDKAPGNSGGFSVYIPDVPNAVTCGDSVPDAIVMAEDVLRMMLQDLAEERKAIPTPSSLERVREMVQAIRKEDGLDYPEDTIYQHIAAPSLDMTPVKVTISLPKAVLETIDERAKALGYTRSGFLAHAAHAYAPAE